VPHFLLAHVVFACASCTCLLQYAVYVKHFMCYVCSLAFDVCLHVYVSYFKLFAESFLRDLVGPVLLQ